LRHAQRVTHLCGRPCFMSCYPGWRARTPPKTRQSFCLPLGM
jgi:hypothetical protein